MQAAHAPHFLPDHPRKEEARQLTCLCRSSSEMHKRNTREDVHTPPRRQPAGTGNPSRRERTTNHCRALLLVVGWKPHRIPREEGIVSTATRNTSARHNLKDGCSSRSDAGTAMASASSFTPLVACSLRWRHERAEVAPGTLQERTHTHRHDALAASRTHRGSVERSGRQVQRGASAGLSVGLSAALSTDVVGGQVREREGSCKKVPLRPQE